MRDRCSDVRALPTGLDGVLLLEHDVHADERGFLVEAWTRDGLAAVGVDASFDQDTLSRSRRGVLRGLHYQLRPPQGKLVRVLEGEIWDVAVDVRRGSPGFGRWTGLRLDADPGRSLWIPPGFAHGFYVLSAEALVLYTLSGRRDPASERALRWDDPALGIRWPLLPGVPLVLSARDRAAPGLAEAEVLP